MNDYFSIQHQLFFKYQAHFDLHIFIYGYSRTRHQAPKYESHLSVFLVVFHENKHTMRETINDGAAKLD